MAVQPNPCLDPCQFYLDTADGKSHLKMGAGLSCDGTGVHVTFPDDVGYSIHSNNATGSIALPNPIAAGIIGPSSGPVAPVQTVGTIGDYTTPVDAQLELEAIANTVVLVSNGGNNAGRLAVSASIDGGVNWIVTHYTDGVCVGGDETGNTSASITAIWQMPAGTVVAPRFLVAYLDVVGAGAAYIRATRLDARFRVHRL